MKIQSVNFKPKSGIYYVFNTGEGLKTIDAVAGQVGPTYQVKPSLKAAREVGLIA